MKEFRTTLRTDKTNKGKAPIHFRTFIKGKPIYIATGISISPKHWNEQEGIISRSFQGSKRINNEISFRLEELNDTYIQVLRKNPNASRKALRSLLVTNREHYMYFKIADDYLEDIMDEGEIGTHDDRKSKIERFKKFCKNDELSIEDLTDELVYKYKKHLLVVKGNKASTTNSNLKCIRAVFNYGIKRHKIRVPFHPFAGFEFAKEDIKRIFLTEEELLQFESVKLNPKTKLATYQDMFLFASKGFGIRVSDLLFLKWKDFDGKHFDFSIMKTRKQLVVKASMALKAIVAKYRSKNNAPENFIFPALKLDPTNMFLLSNRLKCWTMQLAGQLLFTTKD